MRIVTSISLLALISCGGGNESPDAPPGTVIDARLFDAPPADARPDAAVATCTPMAGTGVTTEITAPPGTFSRPVLVVAPPGDRRLFVVEQQGTIRIIDQGVVQTAPFLDLRSDAGGPVNDASNEQGLLSLAFHPSYASNRLFYVFYTNAAGDEVLASYRGNGATADATSAIIMMTIDDFATNHNGGHLEFGPDGYLYVSVGDGGGGGDPDDNGQDQTQMLGKIHRIDVDNKTGSKEYGIPITNPHAAGCPHAPSSTTCTTVTDGVNDPRPEMWAYGLRNPFRFSFDRQTGDLYIGDVGQNAKEEFNFQAAASTGGENYGWDAVEGTICHNAGCSFAGKVAPVHDYDNVPWCSAMGGSVYRGSCFPGLVGRYFYSDYCVAQIWAWTVSNPADHAQVTAAMPSGVTSINADALGELYVTVFDGSIRHIIAQ